MDAEYKDLKDELNNALTARDALKGYADWAKEELVRLRAALDAAKQRAELTEGLLLKCDESRQEAERLFLIEHDKLTKWIERAEAAEQRAAEAEARNKKLAKALNSISEASEPDEDDVFLELSGSEAERIYILATEALA